MTSDTLESFRMELLGAGIPIHDPLIADGKLHRYKTGKDHQANCWYILHDDAHPAGAFGCWKRNLDHKWHSANGSSEPDAETQQRWKDIAKLKRDEMIAAQQKAAERSESEWNSATPAFADHPYLTKKRIHPHGARIAATEAYKDWLVIDLRDYEGKLHSLQFIAPDGTKRFVYQGRKKGCFHFISHTHDTNVPLIICEGFATGATLNEALGFPVACGLDCGNLLPVARALRHAFPERRILICADNDRETEGNPGVTKATEAAEATNAILVIPQFPDAIEGSDFNDIANAPNGGSLHEVTTQVQLAITAWERMQSQQLPEPEPSEYLPTEPDSDSPVFNLPLIVDSAVFTAVPIPKPPELVAGLIHQGTKIIVGGGSKSFKTWIQLDLAICIAYGLPWLGHTTTQGRVLFVNFEIQPAFFQERINAILKAKGIIPEPGRLDVWNLRGHSAPYRLILPRMIERVKTTPYTGMVLDPIYKLYGSANENDASEVASLMNGLEEVCVKTGSATIFGAHYSKGNQSSKESIDRISGSGVFARDPDTIIPFTRHEEEGSFVIEPTLRNLPPVDPFVVTWNYPLFDLDSSLDPSKLKQISGRPKATSEEALFDLLPPSGLTWKEWLSEAQKTLKISESTFCRLKKALKDRDIIMFSRINETWKPLQKQ